MAEAERPKIGVGVVIHDGKGNIIMGERAGSHGAGTSLLHALSCFSGTSTWDLNVSIYLLCPGTMQCPGGHLEYGESFAETAARESLEETGLEIGNIKFLTATNDVFGEGKHYVTIFVTAEIMGENKIAQVGGCPESRTGTTINMKIQKQKHPRTLN